jgi:ribosomal protein S18 acetylase RimI-like enzyme
LFWAINHIRHKNSDPVTLHVAEWNQNAVRMYENAGCTVTRTVHIQ